MYKRQAYFRTKNGVTGFGHAVICHLAAFFRAAGVLGRITFSFSTKPVLAGMYSSCLLYTSCMSREELEREYDSVLASYEACKAQGLNLNMARGKPATEQLDMVSGLLTVLQTPEDCYDDGVDARNYGELAGRCV